MRLNPMMDVANAASINLTSLLGVLQWTNLGRIPLVAN